MREIMKLEATRVFDFDICFESLAASIMGAIHAIPSDLPDTAYDININVHQSAARDEATLKLLLITAAQANQSPKLRISPKEDVTAILTVFEELRLSTLEHKILLDILSSNRINEILEQLQILISGLKTAASIYEAFGERRLRNIGFELNSISESASFASTHCVIRFQSGKQSTHFNNNDYRNQLSEEISSLLKCIVDYSEPVLTALSSLIINNVTPRNRTYIPTLRTARTLTGTNKKKIHFEEDVLHSTIEADYELARNHVTVNTGLALYAAIDGKRSSHLADREEFKQFEDFLSETFFNGKLVEVVPNRKNTTILVTVDREERELPHLGDGIQAIILLLYPLFIAPKRAWFFIEEPETHLHPGFQRLFIKTIATHPILLEKELTVFLTTHSNHMLDYAFDEAKNINLFTFRKSLGNSRNATYQVQLTAPHDLDCLAALGVQNSSVFLSNCTIWVEGITDRIYLKAYLEVYLKHRHQTFSLLEGLHYSFLEYAGANVAHYTFGSKSQQVKITDEALQSIQALSISNRIMLIADQDSGKDAKHERLTAQKHIGFEYVMLPTREIENLLTPRIIAGVLKRLYPKFDFDASKLQQEQYHSIYLGHYLRKKFSYIPETFAPPKPKGSGTISSAKKRIFAEAAAKEITDWDTLSIEAKKLTENIFKFIIAHNPRLGSN